MLAQRKVDRPSNCRGLAKEFASLANRLQQAPGSSAESEAFAPIRETRDQISDTEYRVLSVLLAAPTPKPNNARDDNTRARYGWTAILRPPYPS